jgi:hypothetical protein
MPGYINPQVDPLSLPNNHSSAFQTEEFEPDIGTYFSIGALFLQRQRLSHGEIAVFEPTVGNNLGSGIPLPDSGQPPSLTAIPVQRYERFSNNWNYAITGDVGYYWNGQSIEAGGFFMFQRRQTLTNTAEGQLDTFFFNAPPQFGGDNGLWRQADIIQSTYKQQLASAEVNYRCTDLAVWDIELILGVRYIDQIEQVGIFTDDGGLLANTTDFTRQATFTAQTKNRIVGPQLGFEYNRNPFSWLQVGGIGKVAVGPNFREVETRLERGDHLLGFDVRNYDTHWVAGVGDIKLYADWTPLERFRLRAAYNALFFVGVTEAASQVNFDLANPLSNSRHVGNVFYHGPSIELMFFF